MRKLSQSKKSSGVSRILNAVFRRRSCVLSNQVEGVSASNALKTGGSSGPAQFGANINAGVQIEEPFAVLALDAYCGVCEKSVQDLMSVKGGELPFLALKPAWEKVC